MSVLFSAIAWTAGVIGGVAAIAVILDYFGITKDVLWDAVRGKFSGWKPMSKPSRRETVMAVAALFTISFSFVALYSFRKADTVPITPMSPPPPTVKPLTVHANIVWVRAFWTDGASTDYLVLVRFINNGPDTLFNAWKFVLGPIPVVMESWRQGSKPFILPCGDGHSTAYTDKDLAPDHIRVHGADQAMLLFFLRIPGGLTTQNISALQLRFQDGFYNNYVTDQILQAADVANRMCYPEGGPGTYK